MPTDAKSLSHVVGERLRALRIERNLRQDEAAAMARSIGLPWTRATVAAIETGRRELPPGELLLLPFAFHVELDDLIPPGATVQLTPAVSARGKLVHRVLKGKALSQSYGTWTEHPRRDAEDLEERLMSRVTDSLRLQQSWPELSAGEVQDAHDGVTEVETRAAKRLGVDPVDLALASRRRWGHGFTVERDRRAPEGVTSRGHITRALLDELRPDLEAAGLLKKGR